MKRAIASAVLMLGALMVLPTSGARAEDPIISCPIIVTHATNKYAAPENTVVGINSVRGTGSTWVEMDPRWSVSGYPVLMHDETVDRTTPGTGKVASLGLSQMTSLSATGDPAFPLWKSDPVYDDAKVPYAWDFFNAINKNDLQALLDVKVTPTDFGAAKLMEYADRFAGMRDRITYMASAESIKKMRSLYPDLRYSLIEYPPPGRMATGEYLQSLGATMYNIPAREIHSRALVDYYHSYGVILSTWVSDNPWDTPEVRANMRSYGVDMITTNYPAQAIAECTPTP